MAGIFTPTAIKGGKSVTISMVLSFVSLKVSYTGLRSNGAKDIGFNWSRENHNASERVDRTNR